MATPPKPAEYRTLFTVVQSSTVSELERRLSERVEEGWRVHGGISVTERASGTLYAVLLELPSPNDLVMTVGPEGATWSRIPPLRGEHPPRV